MRHILPLAAVSLLGALGASLTGCNFDEGIEIYDLHGKVVLSEEAATRTLLDGTLVEDDVRLIGPVYLGLFPGVETGTFDYPYPEVGPAFQAGLPGDTYPYGGVTVGDLRFACMDFLACKVTSGRFVDFDSLVDWFQLVNQPIIDGFGEEVDSGEYLRQTCFELLNYTSDDEIRVTATQDRNDDGKLDELDLDFIQRNDGKWEADFTIYQMEWFEGFSLWGWMDAPSESVYNFNTCDPDNGYSQQDYNVSLEGGRQELDLLNYPAEYIQPGDMVPALDPADGAYVWDSPEAIHEIEIDYVVEE